MREERSRAGDALARNERQLATSRTAIARHRAVERAPGGLGPTNGPRRRDGAAGRASWTRRAGGSAARARGGRWLAAVAGRSSANSSCRPSRVTTRTTATRRSGRRSAVLGRRHVGEAQRPHAVARPRRPAATAGAGRSRPAAPAGWPRSRRGHREGDRLAAARARTRSSAPSARRIAAGSHDPGRGRAARAVAAGATDGRRRRRAGASHAALTSAMRSAAAGDGSRSGCQRLAARR